MDIMNQHGLTVWLNPSTQVLLSRLKHEQAKRPLIAGLSEEALETFILNKTQEREVYYRQAAIITQSADCPIDLIENKIKQDFQSTINQPIYKNIKLLSKKYLAKQGGIYYVKEISSRSKKWFSKIQK